jgi:plasmid maintenance system antidote protein VapI
MKKTEILPKDIWNANKMERVNSFISNHSKNLSEDEKLNNKLLTIQYKLEDYIQKEDIEEDEMLEILDFVKMYLRALNITKKDLAHYFGMGDSNLHKYLTGQRKLNPNIVLKISSFSHTNPEDWYRVQVKNEIAKLKNEKSKDYEKYDYKKLLSL